MSGNLSSRTIGLILIVAGLVLTYISTPIRYLIVEPPILFEVGLPVVSECTSKFSLLYPPPSIPDGALCVGRVCRLTEEYGVCIPEYLPLEQAWYFAYLISTEGDK